MLLLLATEMEHGCNLFSGTAIFQLYLKTITFKLCTSLSWSSDWSSPCFPSEVQGPMMFSVVTTQARQRSTSLCREDREFSLWDGTRKGDTSLDTGVNRHPRTVLERVWKWDSVKVL